MQFEQSARSRASSVSSYRRPSEWHWPASGLGEYLGDTTLGRDTMHAIDVMTHSVVTVDPDTTVQDLATLLSDRGISGAPVVDANGRMIGIVSEGDMLHRAELGTERRDGRRSSWWLEHYASGLARDYVKSHGRTVKDIMTRNVVTVTEETDLAEIAML